MAKQKVEYDEKAIKSLDALSHIRLRTGMYIGRIGDGSNPSDGIYVLLKEIVDIDLPRPRRRAELLLDPHYQKYVVDIEGMIDDTSEDELRT